MIQLSSLPAAQHHLLFFLSLFTYASHLDFCLISIKRHILALGIPLTNASSTAKSSLTRPPIKFFIHIPFILPLSVSSQYLPLSRSTICLLAFFPFPPPDSRQLTHTHKKITVPIAGSSEVEQMLQLIYPVANSIIKDQDSFCHSLCFNLKLVFQGHRSQEQ